MGAELLDGGVAEDGLDDAPDVAGVAVAGAVLQLSLAEPLVDRVAEAHRGGCPLLPEHLGAQLGQLVLGLAPGGLIGAADRLALVHAAAGHGVDAGIDHDAQRLGMLPLRR
ncbi:MAG TPA: hypothetical protein VGX25_13900 [Actinophytocola sp.]|uniref:hypothetical protein n=1 Tax=Actinophytocola sp. TaxID=1872138 RepID=UPI002DDD02F8|nr:hypothetical protein [Actinophytocola sp.]HEV2780479.1 hypothetical protein [Actinophytocola sp.]